MFYENWQSRELWQSHMESQHLKDYISVTEDAIEAFTLNEMTHLS
jgi:quinol monooxygenase YgiN